MNYPCPLCKRLKTIQINRKHRPYLRCDNCGVLMFINKSEGISILKEGKKVYSARLEDPSSAGHALFGN